jgi:prepilin-type N-terminal cleavage/methylation domain-containing protein
MRRVCLRDESGFTLIEVLVASVILLVGLTGTMTLLDVANRTTSSNTARDGGVALQRELIEVARSLPYSQLTPGTLSTDVRATSGFDDSAITGKGWTVRRGGVDYHVAVGVCVVDSAADGLGAHDASTFCATGSGSTTAAQCSAALGTGGSVQGTGVATGGQVGDCGIDTNLDGEVDGLTGSPPASGTADTSPEDFKRIVALVRWDKGEGNRFVLASTTLPYPGLSAAPAVTTLAPASAALQNTNPPTVSAGAQTAVPFTAATNRAAASLGWFVNGSPVGTATNAGGGVSWSFTWNLGTVNLGATAPGAGEVVDGIYNIGARAYNRYGAGGQIRAYTLSLNRRPPFRPAAFVAVHLPAGVEMAWAQSVERDVEGFRTDRVASNGARTTVCALSRSTACLDDHPPTTGTYSYEVVAVDRATDGSLRDGDAASAAIALDNRTPQAPSGLRATRNGSQVTLDWTASSGDPDGTVASYRIFRDGQDIRARYGTAQGVTWTDTSAADGAHTYCVAAVDNLDAQSACSDPVTA